MKKKIFLISTLVLMLGLTGCSNLSSFGSTTSFSYEEKAKKLLEEQYECEFIIDDVQSIYTLDGYYTVIAHSKNNPDIVFKASINTDGSGLSDNYGSKLINKKISEVIENNLGSIKDNVYVYTTPLIETIGITNANMTIEEYMQQYPSDTFHIYLNYCSDEVTSLEIINSLNSMFNDLDCLNGNIYLYGMPEHTLRYVEDYLKENDKMYDECKNIIDSYYIVNIPFLNGKITMNYEELQSMINN